jgi:hypothetical protein
MLHVIFVSHTHDMALPNFFLFLAGKNGMLDFFYSWWYRIDDSCVYARNVFISPLEALMCFFHETIKKDSIPSNRAVFGFDKTADKKNDFSCTMYQKASCRGSCQVISF